MTKQLFFTLAIQTIFSALYGQNIPLPTNSKSQYLLDRWSVLAHDSVYQSSLPSQVREVASERAMQIIENQRFSNKKDQFDAQYVLNENACSSPAQTQVSNGHIVREKPIFKYFYRTPAHFFSLVKPDFSLVINPQAQLVLGKENDRTNPIFRNERGLELYGSIAKRLHFYTSVLEIQRNYPSTHARWIAETQAYPGASLLKNYTSTVSDKLVGKDYNIAEAYIKGNLMKQIGFQFGHSRHQIGNGYRSMILSDFGPVYLNLRLDTRIWKLSYTNIFTEMSATRPFELDGSAIAQKKYLAAHYLNFQATKKWNIGLYETTVFEREQGFELQYLNPVIFYRSVEGAIGSPDNVLVGLNTSYQFAKTCQAYGQIMLDEFLFNALFSPEERGWWGNKSGLQLGLKYFNAFKINHLDLQMEYNSARPYTYSHTNTITNYTHFGQSLAHPLGANFREVLAIARYQATNRLSITAKAFRWKRGSDTATGNYGGNPYLSYQSRVNDYGNKIGQGVASVVQLASIEFSYALAHNLFIDLGGLYREENSVENSLDQQTQLANFGLRYNIWNRREEL
jgi:hypothetical protein